MKKSCRNNSVMAKNQQIWNLRKEIKTKILIEEDLEEAFGSTSTEEAYIHNPSNELQCEGDCFGHWSLCIVFSTT